MDETQGKLLRQIIDEVIGGRRARSFLLERQYERNEVIRSLFDSRVIHLVQRGYADKDNPGLRYNIYTLDYGTYVDLLGTQKAPIEDFTEQLGETGEEVVVPFDDKRSIRRIIFRPEHLRTTFHVKARTGRSRRTLVGNLSAAGRKGLLRGALTADRGVEDRLYQERGEVLRGFTALARGVH